MTRNNRLDDNPMPSLVPLDYRPRTALDVLDAPPNSTPAARPKRPAGSGIFSRLIGYGMKPWRRRSLRGTFDAAKLALGERMFAAGIDDGALGALISGVDDHIRRAEAVSAPTRALRAEQQRLLVRLAEAALEEQAPLPGAEDEYDHARQAEAALRDYDAAVAGYATL